MIEDYRLDGYKRRILEQINADYSRFNNNLINNIIERDKLLACIENPRIVHIENIMPEKHFPHGGAIFYLNNGFSTSVGN